jgi:hypothetical protein
VSQPAASLFFFTGHLHHSCLREAKLQETLGTTVSHQPRVPLILKCSGTAAVIGINDVELSSIFSTASRSAQIASQYGEKRIDHSLTLEGKGGWEPLQISAPAFAAARLHYFDEAVRPLWSQR